MFPKPRVSLNLGLIFVEIKTATMCILSNGHKSLKIHFLAIPKLQGDFSLLRLKSLLVR